MHFPNYYGGQTFAFLGTPQPVQTGELTYGAIAYVWVETRLSSCMPGNGEVPGASIFFMKPDVTNSFLLAQISGIPSQVALVLSLYSDNCATFLFHETNSQNQNALATEGNGSSESNQPATQPPSSPGPTSSVSTPSPEKNRSPSLKVHRQEHVTTVNVVVNIATYRLLTSYDCFPLRQLEWLTHAEFSIALRKTLDDRTTAIDRARVCIKGGQAEVRSAAVVLKEIMIFIGNRFTLLFGPASFSVEEVTPVRKARPRADASPDSSDQVKQPDIKTNSNKTVNETPGDYSVPHPENQCHSPPTRDADKATGDGEHGDKWGKETPTLQIFLVAESETGKVIGYKGDNIKKIETDTGAYVQMAKIDLKVTDREVRAVFLVGTRSAVDYAMKLILNCVSYSMSLSISTQGNNS